MSTPEANAADKARLERRRKASPFDRPFVDAADVIAAKAGEIEVFAAKNEAAGYDGGAQRKRARAMVLRRLAAFLVDPRFLSLMREDTLMVSLLTDPSVKFESFHIQPRVFAPGSVRPTVIRPRDELGRIVG